MLLYSERGISFTATDAAIDYLIKRGGYDPELGARPMRQAIAREFESGLAQRILAGTITSGDLVRIGLDEASDTLLFEMLPEPVAVDAETGMTDQAEC